MRKHLSNIIRYSTEPSTCTPCLSTSKPKETNPFRSVSQKKKIPSAHFSLPENIFLPLLIPTSSSTPFTTTGCHHSWLYSVWTRTSGSKSNLIRAQRVTAHGDIPLPPFNNPADGRERDGWEQKGRKAAPKKTKKSCHPVRHLALLLRRRREKENHWAVCNVPG
jgi:hypothetical protein